jgi:hypothetical protein
MLILGIEECEVLRLLDDGEHHHVRVLGEDAVFDDGTRVSRKVLRYLLAASPPIVLDIGAPATGLGGPREHRVQITMAGRCALALSDKATEDRPAVIWAEELHAE